MVKSVIKDKNEFSEAKPMPRDAGLPWYEKCFWQGFQIAESYHLPGNIEKKKVKPSIFEVTSEDVFQQGKDPQHYWNKKRILELVKEDQRQFEGTIDSEKCQRPKEFVEECARAKGVWEDWLETQK